jgi:hypothetical protein
MNVISIPTLTNVEKGPLSLLMSRSILTSSRPSQIVLRTATRRTLIPLHSYRGFSSTVSIMNNQTQKLKPAARVQGQKKDVW